MKNVGVTCRVVIDDVNLEVRRALDCNCTEISYLARQLSVLVNRQLVTGLSRTIVRGVSAYGELDGKRRDNDLYWFGPLD
jgi:hypothetical protein